ncbi:HAD-IC family P-type ATPase [Kribbella sindirgiensis]|uniref:HAD family hydrolase n=1 Tax=Kribbella sindirgiensis TaxID=1124744 RepID=A0A4R0I4N7_9ACTN|nr:HAD-IC family P-type ATPase [Kribbella sindirgiensis]TCC21578.1 HAD family hydrolase [Kribbella sindirgiensis]
MSADSGTIAPASRNGLSAAEVAERVADGRTNAVQVRTSRTYGQIVRANVFTFFNGLLGVLFVAVLATGKWVNALFGLVIITNAGIGIVQEVRAKRTLDRLALLNVTRAWVVRDGTPTEIDAGDVVQDDLVRLRAGDQVLADGVVTAADGLEIDESLLTGESEPVNKAAGDEVRSGSIVVAGTGEFVARAVGAATYAAKLAAEARRFQITRSELVAGTTRLLRWISLVLLVVAPVLLWSQFRSADNKNWRDAVTGTVAAVVGMIPEGLVLLTSLAFMLAIVTLARRQTLVQELPAVEGLARVDVVCLDKTGTLTHGDIVFDRIEPLTDEPVDEVLALIADGGDSNATSDALRAAVGAATLTASARVPFSSARKWQSVTVDGTTWVLGAPEMVLLDEDDAAATAARDRANKSAADGERVLVLARGVLRGGQADGARVLPAGLVPVALVVLAENIRDDAAATMEYFTAQGVALKVLSGDNPRTVGAVAAAVGVPGVAGAGDAVDARTLPDDPQGPAELDALADVLDRSSAFGRVSPHQKRAFVAALQRRGHVVAMTGDGVNDALALKDADIGVAMGNGSPATRAVAQLVLLDGKFAHLPDVVAEGRRVIANIERAANLFLVKNVYSLVLSLITATTMVAYPLEPIQLTLISALTIGIPAFFLALGPNTRRYLPGFLGRVLRFAVPVGLVTAVCAFAGYRLVRVLDPGAGVAGARTVTTVVVLVVSLWTLSILAWPLRPWKVVLLVAMVVLGATAVLVPPIGHSVFLLDVTPYRVLGALTMAFAGIGLVELVYRITRPSARNGLEVT